MSLLLLNETLRKKAHVIFKPAATTPAYTSGVDTELRLLKYRGGNMLSVTRGTIGYYTDENGVLRKVDAHAAMLYGRGWFYEESVENSLLNSDGPATHLTFSGQTGNTNAHILSAVARSESGGNVKLQFSSQTAAADAATTTDYVRYTSDGLTPPSSSETLRMTFAAGDVYYVYLTGMEEQPASANKVLFGERTSAFLTGSYLRCPGTSGHVNGARINGVPDITGDQSWRCKIALDDYASNLAVIATAIGQIRILDDGKLQFSWQDSSSAYHSVETSVVPAFTNGQAYTIKVDLDVDDGAGGHSVTFEYSTNDGSSWTQIGDPVNAGAFTTDVKSTTADYTVGYRSLTATQMLGGNVYNLQIYSDLTETSIELDIDFTAESADTPGDDQNNVTTFTESSVNAATVRIVKGIPDVAISGDGSSKLLIASDAAKINTYGGDGKVLKVDTSGAAPATQTTSSLTVGVYCLFMTGTGSVALSEGTASIVKHSTTAEEDDPVVFDVYGAGTVTVTVTGSARGPERPWASGSAPQPRATPCTRRAARATGRSSAGGARRHTSPRPAGSATVGVNATSSRSPGTVGTTSTRTPRGIRLATSCTKRRPPPP